jgi:hypothetical protein
VRRIRAAEGLLPESSGETSLARCIEAAETLKTLVGYWMEATRGERLNYVRLLVMPEGLRYDLPHQRIMGLQPHTAFLKPLRLALANWSEKDGILRVPS